MRDERARFSEIEVRYIILIIFFLLIFVFTYVRPGITGFSTAEPCCNLTTSTKFYLNHNFTLNSTVSIYAYFGNSTEESDLLDFEILELNYFPLSGDAGEGTINLVVLNMTSEILALSLSSLDFLPSQVHIVIEINNESISGDLFFSCNNYSSNLFEFSSLIRSPSASCFGLGIEPDKYLLDIEPSHDKEDCDDVFENSGNHDSCKNDDEDKEEKCTICHYPPGNPANRQTLDIDCDAVQTHLNHSDTVGKCRANVTLFTNQPIYGLNETVHLFGDGYTPVSAVNLSIFDSNPLIGPGFPTFINSDGFGNVSFSWNQTFACPGDFSATSIDNITNLSASTFFKIIPFECGSLNISNAEIRKRSNHHFLKNVLTKVVAKDDFFARVGPKKLLHLEFGQNLTDGDILLVTLQAKNNVGTVSVFEDQSSNELAVIPISSFFEDRFVVFNNITPQSSFDLVGNTTRRCDDDDETEDNDLHATDVEHHKKRCFINYDFIGAKKCRIPDFTLRGFKSITSDISNPQNFSVNIEMKAFNGNITELSMSDYLPTGALIANHQVVYHKVIGSCFNSTVIPIFLQNFSDYLLNGSSPDVLPDGQPVDIYKYDFFFNFTNWAGVLFNNERLTIDYNVSVLGGGDWTLPTLMAAFDPSYQKHITTERTARAIVPIFDVSVDVINHIVKAGESVKAILSMLNIGGPNAQVDVHLIYSVKDEDGSSITERSETFAVRESKTKELSLYVPKDTEEGQYFFESLVTYVGREAVSTDVFSVDGKQTFFTPPLIYSLLILFSFSIFLFSRVHKHELP